MLASIKVTFYMIVCNFINNLYFIILFKLFFRYLNLSENNLHYLPFGITYLQLDVFDVTDNFLTNNNLSNTNILYSAEFKHEIRLEHLAVTSVNSTLR